MVTRNPIQDEPADAAAAPPPGQAARDSTERAWSALNKAWHALGTHLPGMRKDLACLAAVQADRARLAVFRAVLKLASGLLLLIVTGAVLATAATLVVIGVAGGMAAALGGNAWLANLITGAAMLALVFGVGATAVQIQRHRRLRRLKRRYRQHEEEHRHHAERS